MSLSLATLRSLFIGQNYASSGGRANVGLNAAYVHRVSGAAVAIRFTAMTADPIDEAYFFLDANGGTLGSITMACAIYNEDTVINRPGTTLRATSTATVMPAAVDRWIKFTFGAPYTPVAGEILWLICYNTAAVPATNFPNILTATTTIWSPGGRFQGWSTVNGFSTAGTAQGEAPAVIKQGSTVYGQPVTGVAAVGANNALERGMLITPPATMELYGVEGGGATQLTAFRILEESAAPGATPLHSFSYASIADQLLDRIIGMKVFPVGSRPVLTGGVTYRATFTYSANTTAMTSAPIEDYASYPAIFDALFDNFSVCPKIIDNGAGGWTQSNDALPNVQLYVSDFPASGGLMVAGTPMLRGMV